MPRIEIEIMGETTKTISERITVVADVPQEVLNGDLQTWVEEQMQDGNSQVSKEANDPVNIFQEDETEGFDITSVTYLGPHD